MSIQMLTTGVLSELLSRTFFESSGSTAYHVLEMDGDDSGWKQPQ